ncbi:lysozyme inhibitor LprI family protein [Pectobacterium parmentieri]|nr:lysozyme inhibitor LprI family protein [Pectobacterium parmentieri]
MIRNKIIFLFLLIASNAVQAIVCSVAQSDVEKKICSSEPLMQLDTALNKWYSQVEKSQINPARLHEDERNWLQQRDQCADESCLIASYKFRLSQLRDIERYSDARTVTSSLKIVRMTQSMPYVSEGNSISFSGSEYSLQAENWVYKPFYTDNERLKTLEQLKKIHAGTENDTRVKKIVGSVITDKNVYLYILHYNGIHLYDSISRKNTYFHTSQLVQISEQGDVTIVDTSSDEKTPKNPNSGSDYELHSFDIDDRGNIYFINNENPHPTLKKWSASQQKIEILSDDELSQYRNKHPKKGTWSWTGKCGDVECNSRVGIDNSAHYALHYPKPNRQNPRDDYTVYDAHFADSLFYIKKNGDVETIVKENDNNKNTWFLFSEPTCASDNACYFVNHHDMAGVWRINQKTKTLTHITPLSRIDRITATRYKNKDYIFMLFDSMNHIYVATSQIDEGK